MHLLKHIGILAKSTIRHKLLDPYLDVLTARPSGQHQWLINRMLLEADGALPTGYLGITMSETAQAALQNIIRPAVPFVKVGSPTFTANLGAVSSDVANRYDTTETFNVIPGITQSTYSYGFFCNTTANTASGYDFGVSGGGFTYGNSMVAYTTESSVGVAAYGSSTTAISSGLVTVTSALGMTLHSRTANNSRFLMRDGVVVATGTEATSNFPNQRANFLANYTTAGNRRQAIQFIGGAMSQTQGTTFSAAINRLVAAW